MDSDTSFKVPSTLPQDLQLIQDLVGSILAHAPSAAALPKAKQKEKEDNGSSIASSHSGSDSDPGSDSENEVLANILGTGAEDAESTRGQESPDSSDSDSEDSDSDVPGVDYVNAQARAELEEFDDDEDGGPPVTAGAPLKTAHEVEDTEIPVPDITEVGSDEQLEKVGEILSVMEKVVIVRGIPSLTGKAAERALDSETLLVFDDRRVLGYIYETFGPTQMPLYQVKFGTAFPLNPEHVRVSREVFHVPSRSKFIFVNAIKHLRGSDASNAHDEEPGADELEFSDDEQERAHKRAMDQKRASRRDSRQPTPSPSQMRDQEIAEEKDPYDLMYSDPDFGAGPSRPPPVPYDDPYSDHYGLASPAQSGPSSQAHERQPSRGHERPATRGRGRGHERQRSDRGRERGRSRGRGRGGWTDERRQSAPSNAIQNDMQVVPDRPPSPTTLAIARATGQFADGSSFPSSFGQESQYPSYGDGWNAPIPAQSHQQPFYGYDTGSGQPYVQPHINPRFAAALGFTMGYSAPVQQNAYTPNAAQYSVSLAQRPEDWNSQIYPDQTHNQPTEERSTEKSS